MHQHMRVSTCCWSLTTCFSLTDPPPHTSPIHPHLTVPSRSITPTTHSPIFTMSAGPASQPNEQAGETSCSNTDPWNNPDSQARSRKVPPPIPHTNTHTTKIMPKAALVFRYPTYRYLTQSQPANQATTQANSPRNETKKDRETPFSITAQCLLCLSLPAHL
jgi:hypothetical protein